MFFSCGVHFNSSCWSMRTFQIATDITIKARWLETTCPHQDALTVSILSPAQSSPPPPPPPHTHTHMRRLCIISSWQILCVKFSHKGHIIVIFPYKSCKCANMISTLSLMFYRPIYMSLYVILKVSKFSWIELSISRKSSIRFNPIERCTSWDLLQRSLRCTRNSPTFSASHGEPFKNLNNLKRSGS